MKVLTVEFQLSTQGDTDCLDITDEVSRKLADSKMKEGSALIFVVGSTAGLTTIEFEPGLISDIKETFQKLIPKNISYKHDMTWGDANGFSHLRASLLGPSLLIPFKAGRLILGTWQQIVLIDFDNRPRQRKIVVQFQGE